MTTTPAGTAAATSRASAALAVKGFSHSTCLPAARAAMVQRPCSPLGSGLYTASMSGSADELLVGARHPGDVVLGGEGARLVVVAGRHGDDLGPGDVSGGADDRRGCDPRRAEHTDADGRHRSRLQASAASRARADRVGRWTSACQSPVSRTALRMVPASRSHERTVSPSAPRGRCHHQAASGMVLDERPALGQGQPGRGQAGEHPDAGGVLDADRVGLRPPGAG